MKRSITFLVTSLLLIFVTFGCGSGNSEVAEPAASSHAKPVTTAQPETPVAPPVEEEPAAKPTVLLDPNQIDPAQPIPANALYEAFFADKNGWLGKQVTVEGYYKGSTYSSATDETRVDLKPDQMGKAVVGCMIQGEGVTPKSAAKQRAGVVIRGTIAEPFFGQVILRDAVFLNRE